MMPKRIDPQAEVDKWNASVKVGDEVEYREFPKDDPQRFIVRTCAEVLSGHTAVVWLDGKRGCVCIRHCRRLG